MNNDLDKIHKLDYNRKYDFTYLFTQAGSGGKTFSEPGRVQFIFYNGTNNVGGAYINSSLKGEFAITVAATHGSCTQWIEVESGEGLSIQLIDSYVSFYRVYFYPYL